MTETAAGVRVRRSSAGWWQRLTWSESFWAFWFILPSMIGLALVIISVVYGFGISFTNWDILSPPRWRALGNYQELLFDDKLFWKTMANTAYYAIGVVPLGTMLALLAAVIMNQGLKGQTIFRSVYFLPTVSSGIAIALLWQWLYNTNFGLINWMLMSIGLPKISWLGDRRVAMIAVIIMSIWRGLGYNMVLFLAGLQGIEKDYFEAATIDGASRWQSFRHITFPLISPTTFFIVVLSIIGSFQVFEATYIMTGGGPFYSTYTIVLYIFEKGFRFFQMGYASALAYLLFLVIMLLTVFQLRMEKRWVHYA
ncbi:MAG: carbohydrate ABC transporter permease [Anaerolineae bacterium]